MPAGAGSAVPDGHGRRSLLLGALELLRTVRVQLQHAIDRLIACRLIQTLILVDLMHAGGGRRAEGTGAGCRVQGGGPVPEQTLGPGPLRRCARCHHSLLGQHQHVPAGSRGTHALQSCDRLRDPAYPANPARCVSAICDLRGGTMAYGSQNRKACCRPCTRPWHGAWHPSPESEARLTSCILHACTDIRSDPPCGYHPPSWQLTQLAHAWPSWPCRPPADAALLHPNWRLGPAPGARARSLSTHR